MKTFKSKIGLELFVPISIVLTCLVILTVYQKDIQGFIILAGIILFFVYLYSTTLYQIEGTKLRVKCGFFINELIDIKTISAIKKTNSFFSAPALSLDRIEIFYHQNNSIVISPKDKNEFLIDLLKINPSIKSE